MPMGMHLICHSCLLCTIAGIVRVFYLSAPSVLRKGAEVVAEAQSWGDVEGTAASL